MFGEKVIDTLLAFIEVVIVLIGAFFAKFNPPNDWNYDTAILFGL
jgi:hypothetical protein